MRSVDNDLRAHQQERVGCSEAHASLEGGGVLNSDEGIDQARHHQHPAPEEAELKSAGKSDPEQLPGEHSDDSPEKGGRGLPLFSEPEGFERSEQVGSGFRLAGAAHVSGGKSSGLG